MTTDTSERGLERLICTALTGAPCEPPKGETVGEPSPGYGGVGWTCANPHDYDREYCVDLVQLSAFLRETQPEAAAGIQVDYAVIVDADATVTPWDRGCGCCAGDWSPSGVWLAEVISGADQLYCLCDDGVDCDCDFVTLPLELGTHSATFDWDGRNGEAPWDPGAPFPPGTYTLEVTAVGYWEDAPGGRRWFTIAGTHLLTLVP